MNMMIVIGLWRQPRRFLAELGKMLGLQGNHKQQGTLSQAVTLIGWRAKVTGADVMLFLMLLWDGHTHHLDTVGVLKISKSACASHFNVTQVQHYRNLFRSVTAVQGCNRPLFIHNIHTSQTRK